MKKNTFIWIVGGVLLILVLTFISTFGRTNWMHNDGYGMMGGGYYPGAYGMMGGWMAFGWIIPALFLVFLIAAGVWLGNTLSTREALAKKGTCPHCQKTIATDWQTCPYCSTAL